MLYSPAVLLQVEQVIDSSLQGKVETLLFYINSGASTWGKTTLKRLSSQKAARFIYNICGYCHYFGLVLLPVMKAEQQVSELKFDMYVRLRRAGVAAVMGC
jgi:hypothetical protein